MQKLAEICVRRPVFAGVLILVLIVVGIVGFTRLGVDRYPQVENPTVSVSASYPGASPEAVETEVTELLESSINTVAGIKELRSNSSEGSANVTAVFNLDKNADVATQEVRDKVSQIQGRLPDDVDPPTVRRRDPDAAPVFGFALAANAPLRDVTEYADRIIRPQIESADGVGEIFVAGGQRRQINIIPDPFKLRAYNLTVTDLVTTLQRGNVEIPGGDVETAQETLTLRTEGRVKSVEDFERLIIRGGGGGSIRLGEVARVEDGIERATSASQLNGNPTVLVFVRKQSGVNTLATIDGIKERLKVAETALPPGYSIQVLRDQSEYIEASVHAVEEHLVVGAILATLVVLLFLFNWRATLISAFSIPASIIATFGLMWAFGFTLNIITLLALTLAVGIVIDDTIVVVENIFKFMHEKGMEPFEAAIEGTREIGLAVLATTLSLVAVFLPVAFMEGLTGRLLSSFGITMSFAILVSLVVSFTLAPSLAARWLKPSAKDKAQTDKSHSDNGHGHDPAARFFAPIERTYTEMLEWSMKHRWFVVAACIGVLALTPTLYNMAPFNFLPEDDQSEFDVSARLPEGTSLPVTTRVGEQIAADIKKLPGVESTVMRINGWGGGAATNSADIEVLLKPLDEREQSQDEIMEIVRGKVLGPYRARGYRVSVRPPSALPGFGSSGGRGVQFALTGPDLESLQTTARRFASEVEKLPGVAEADTDFVPGQPEFVASVDRDLAGELGVRVDEVSGALRYLIGGQQVTTYIEGGEQYEVHLRAEEDFRSNPQAIGLWTVSGDGGGGNEGGSGAEATPASSDFITTAVPLDQVVKFRRDEGPSRIQRLNRQRVITVSANTSPGASAGDILTGMEKIYAEMERPPGILGAPAGSSREQQETTRAFLMAIVLSLVFMYLILAAQFESWIHPITILLSLPLTVPFALLSLVLFGLSLNIFSGLGILLLFGVVKKNAILQVDHTNQLRERGMNRYDAIIQANRDRLRPILMTTLAFVAGMIPLVISQGVGAGTNQSIGVVIFGGQTLALLLTLLATPVVYSLLDDAMGIYGRVKSRIVNRGAASATEKSEITGS